MSFLARRRAVILAAATASLGSLIASPAAVSAYECADPEPPHKLVLCSPDVGDVQTVIVDQGLVLTWEVPPREQTTYRSPLQAKEWGVPAGEPVPGITVSGTYGGVVDQRIEIAIIQIGTGQDSGLVGVDRMTVTWSSIYRPGRTSEFNIDATTADRPLAFEIPDPQGGPSDTTTVPNLRIRFESGNVLFRNWTAYFDVEDFEGFHVWRWRSDPTTEPVVVGRASKVLGVFPINEQIGIFLGGRPEERWFISSDLRRIFFVDDFVIDGNVYHYAVSTYDQGFDREHGGTMGALPFDSPLPLPGQADPHLQLRVDFLRPPPQTFTPVQAVPNPYRESQCDPTDRETTCTVRFIHMPSRGTLRIFTLAGDLVRDFDLQGGVDAAGTLRWDTNNGAGYSVASGVYIYQIVDVDSGQESFGRLAIIR